MTSSTINEPFVLSSFSSSSRGKKAQKYTPGVYASSYQKANSSDGFVTIAVQADGVHIFDVSFGIFFGSFLVIKSVHRFRRFIL